MDDNNERPMMNKKDKADKKDKNHKKDMDMMAAEALNKLLGLDDVLDSKISKNGVVLYSMK